MGFLSRLFGKKHRNDAELSPPATDGRPGIDRSSKSSSSETAPPAAPTHDKPTSARVDVGECEKCGRPIRVKQSGVKPTMRLTCKCGHVNVIGSATDSKARISAAIGETMDHSAKGVIMASGHYEGCKLVASIDAKSRQICALEVQFKNAAASKGLADRALAAWRPALASHSFVIPDSLVSQGWRTSKPVGAFYEVMALLASGHHVDSCCSMSKDWVEIET